MVCHMDTTQTYDPMMFCIKVQPDDRYLRDDALLPFYACLPSDPLAALTP